MCDENTQLILVRFDYFGTLLLFTRIWTACTDFFVGRLQSTSFFTPFRVCAISRLLRLEIVERNMNCVPPRNQCQAVRTRYVHTWYVAPCHTALTFWKTKDIFSSTCGKNKFLSRSSHLVEIFHVQNVSTRLYVALGICICITCIFYLRSAWKVVAGGVCCVFSRFLPSTINMIVLRACGRSSFTSTLYYWQIR